MQGSAIHTTYDYSTNTPSMNNFLLTTGEKATRKKLEEDIHLAMLLKHFYPSHNSGTFHLPSLTSLIHCLKNQACEAECSNIVYVDILSEKADCKATLLQVIGNVHKTFIHELNQKWVIAVGDAKVYTLLQAICVEYCDNMKWLITFPGDWHVMYNYQKVLMKPYADARLMQLAKASGYRAETLTSFRNATNFRRTHLCKPLRHSTIISCVYVLKVNKFLLIFPAYNFIIVNSLLQNYKK